MNKQNALKVSKISKYLRLEGRNHCAKRNKPQTINNSKWLYESLLLGINMSLLYE